MTQEEIMAAVATIGGGQFFKVEWRAEVKLRKNDCGKLFTHTIVLGLMGADYDNRASVISAYDNGYAPNEQISQAVKSAYETILPNRVYRGVKDPSQYYLAVQTAKTLFHAVEDSTGKVLSDEDIRNLGLGYYLDQKAKRAEYHARDDKPSDHTRKVKFENLIAIGSHTV